MMEQALPTTRLAAAGICLLAAAFLMGGAAGAQTAPGKPLQLLQTVTQPGKAKPRGKKSGYRFSRAHHKAHLAASAKRAKHAAEESRVTRRQAEAAPTPPSDAAAVVPEPAAQPTAATAVVPEPAAQPTAATETAPETVDSAEGDLSEIVVGGRSVQIVSPNQANDLDMAADVPADVPAVPPATPATATDAQSKPAPKAAAPVIGRGEHADTVGSATWIAQVLAAFGGAVAAGSIAWFLIGWAPQRTYG
jgi:hypothetical protein